MASRSRLWCVCVFRGITDLPPGMMVVTPVAGRRSRNFSRCPCSVERGGVTYIRCKHKLRWWERLAHLLGFLSPEAIVSHRFILFVQTGGPSACLSVTTNPLVCLFDFQKAYYPSSNKFSTQHATFGMFRRHNMNVCLDKSLVTGPDNHVTRYDPLNFHPSYNVNRPSICD